MNRQLHRIDIRALFLLSLLIGLSVFLPQAKATTENDLLSYEGYLTSTDDTPLSGTFKVKVTFYDSLAANCTIKTIEDLSITPNALDGYFNLTFGSASDPNFTKIFSTAIVGTPCAETGATNIQVPAAAMKIQISKDNGTTYETLDGVVAIKSVPRAVQATYLGSKTEADLIAKPSSPGLGSFLKWNGTSSKWDNFVFPTCDQNESLRYNFNPISTDSWTCEAIDDTSKLPLAGGALTGALTISSGGLTVSAGGLTVSSGNINANTGTINNVGHLLMSDSGYLKLSSHSSEPSLTGDAGKTWYRSDNKSIQYYDGSAKRTLATTDTKMFSLNGLDGKEQTFATQVTNTGTVPDWNSTGTTHTLQIPMASGTGVTAGLLSKSDYDTFSGHVSSQWTTIPSPNPGIYYNSGQVAIGTNTPDTAAKVTILDDSDTTNQWLLKAGISEDMQNSAGFLRGTNSNVLLDIKKDNASSIRLNPGSGEASYIQQGKLGIGTITPDSTLTVVGDFRIKDNYDNDSEEIDFSTSNYQYTDDHCDGKIKLKNLKSGGSYFLALQALNDTGTCAFETSGDNKPTLKPLAGHTLSISRNNQEGLVDIHVIGNTAYFRYRVVDPP
ncbi:MAG: hypothetical protein RJB66_1557 [Pseudomonadota bacterium]|jgi:hypothetical protein